MQLTDRQTQAVFARGRDLLVSAAAGSGKTSVLSQRVAALCAEGADVRRMLICTFTNLAAAEMRQRIAALLAQRAGEDKTLRAQAEYAQNADICTIHSFASKVIREHHLLLGLPGKLRTLGNEEVAALKQQAMEAAFTTLYEQEDPDFLLLRDRYAGRDDGPLCALLLRIYDFAGSRPERLDWLLSAAKDEALTEKLEGVLEEMRRERFSHLDVLLSACVELDEEMGWDKQLEKDREDREKLRLFADPANTPEDLSERGKLLRMTSRLEPFWAKERLAGMRKEYKEVLGELCALLQVGRSLGEEADYMRGETARFWAVLKVFDEEYARRKRERSAMDYDDMQHFALKILENEDIARSYRDRYDHVFIDEYQDTNPVQEALLSRVSRPGSRFMVGDSKQSIYRFRLADPAIFIGKADTMEAGSVIRMNENFRSAPGVLRAVNRVMGRVMSRRLGEVDYTEEEALIPGREDLLGETQVLLTQGGGGNAAEREAHTIARQMLRLKREEGFAFSDMCVLLRGGLETAGAAFARVFQSYGIPAKAQGGSLIKSEVEVFVNLLRVIDGMTSDIALLSVLRSHIFGFDEKDLASVRAMRRQGRFADALCESAQREDALGARCREVLEKLEHWRLLAGAMSLPDFLEYVNQDTLYEAAVAAAPGGERKAASFRAFFSACLAGAAEQESLFSLVSSLNESYRVCGTYPSAALPKDQEGVVRILSIHASKGLEFPVVFVARMHNRFNTDDLGRPVLLHAELGLGADIIDEKRRTLRTSVARLLLRDRLTREMKSEELRILYVAMTRAQNRLILSGCIDDLDKAVQNWRQPLSDYGLLRKNNLLDWAMSALISLPCFADWRGEPSKEGGLLIPHSAEDFADESCEGEREGMGVEAALKAAVGKEAKPFLRCKTTGLPSKIGVSTLLPEYTESQRFGEGKPGGASLGTLIHFFLQKADLSARGEGGVLDQIAHLARRELLTPEEEKTLLGCAPMLTRFFESDLARRIRKASWQARELPFSLLVSGRQLGLEDSDLPVVVQGVMDLVFEEAGQLVLVDYKSNQADADSLQKLAGHYRLQMQMYALALKKLSPKPLKEMYLYFLRPGEAVSVPID